MKTIRILTLLTLSAALLGCGGTMPSLGGSSGNAVTGGAGGANSQGENSDLESCDATLGTLAVYEDQSAGWYSNYRRRYPTLGSTVPVLRTMIQQSNCFIIVDRGAGLDMGMDERALMDSGELRSGSSFERGQIVAADYSMRPSIQFSEKDTGGLGAAAGGLLGSTWSRLAGGVDSNEAATTLLLIDNRSSVQIAASVGSAKNFDFMFNARSWFGGKFGGVKGYSDTPEGKVVTAAFVDSYNQMVNSLRNYKAQEVQGGSGQGGNLQVN